MRCNSYTFVRPLLKKLHWHFIGWGMWDTFKIWCTLYNSAHFYPIVQRNWNFLWVSKSLIILLLSYARFAEKTVCIVGYTYALYPRPKSGLFFRIQSVPKEVYSTNMCVSISTVYNIVFEFLQFNHPLTMFTMCILQNNDKILRISVTIVILFANGI